MTTEGGLRVDSFQDELKKTVERIQQAGILLACFVDPRPEPVKASREVGADAIEINTGRYSELAGAEEREEELERIHQAADLAPLTHERRPAPEPVPGHVDVEGGAPGVVGQRRA